MHVKLNHTFDINCHCDSIIDFLANSYFIVQIYHAKTFKMKYIRSLYLNFFKDIHKDTLNVWFDLMCIRSFKMEVLAITFGLVYSASDR